MSLPKDKDASQLPGAEGGGRSDTDPSAFKPVAKPKGTSKVALVLTTVVIAGLVAAAAFYQESIVYFFHLRAWDRGAPAQTVAKVLAAARKGDQGQAGQYVSGQQMQPIVEEGKWVGYQVRYGATNSEARLKDMIPEGEPAPLATEFVYVAEGSAVVTMPAPRGATVDYRLEPVGGNWKLTGLHLERPRSGATPSPSAPRGPGGSAPANRAPQ
jgi:uncharacterized membrane protein